MIKVNSLELDGDIEGSDTMVVMTTSSKTDDSEEQMGTMVVNSDAGTLLESDMGTIVINSDDDSTMKREWLLFMSCYVFRRFPKYS